MAAKLKPFPLVLLCLTTTQIAARPQNTRPLVITSTTTAASTTSELPDDKIFPQITEFHVRSDIQYRYARTMVNVYVKNPSIRAREVTFHMTLPKSAFVSNFSMTLSDKKEYVADVKPKEVASNIYDEAVGRGNSAAIAKTDARDANIIQVSTNVEAGEKARFKLTYEYFLERTAGKYEHVVHVEPGQTVKDLKIEVFINETLPVVNVRVPELKTNVNDITSTLDDNADVKIDTNVDNDPAKAMIKYEPTSQPKGGLKGQFIVQYDVERNKDKGNDIQVVDGYFVHFFAPKNLPALPKHVTFVLDVSGSMAGTSLRQTKDAMVTVLDDMTENDSFNIITFSDDVYHWKPEKLQTARLSYPGSEEVKSEALEYVLKLVTLGGTNIHDAMLAGINKVTEVRRSEELPGSTKSMIIFLTDGEATTGVTDDKTIKSSIREANALINVPIYGLAFGNGADFGLITDISTESKAFARRIYAASDAAIQLEDFYLSIASPLLNNVEFKYVGQTSNVTHNLDTFFDGSEYVVTGTIDDAENEVQVQVRAGNYEEKFNICLRPLPVVSGDVPELFPPVWPCHGPGIIPVQNKTSANTNFVERLWAFRTLKNLLKSVKTADENDEPEVRKQAVDLALKYNFVSEVTSLVITKPLGDGTGETAEVVDPVPATTNARNFFPVLTAFQSTRSSGPIVYSAVPFQTKSGPPARRGPYRTTTTAANSFSLYDMIEDYDLSGGVHFSNDNFIPTTTLGPACQGGNVTLYEKTYLRGQSLTADQEIVDLGDFNFDNKVTSLKVEGQCCWTIFSGPNFAGKSQNFKPGEYKSATDILSVFRDASSLKRMPYC